MPNADDPFDELREVAAAAGRRAEKLPPERVRALGTRRRRRRMTAMVAGTCLGVSAVTGGAVATVGQFRESPDDRIVQPSVSESPSERETQRTPETSPSPDPPDENVDNTPPAQGWRTSIPDGYDLAVQLPDYGGNVQGPGSELRPFGTLEACGEQAYPGEPEASDRLALSFQASESSYAQPRELTVYEDAQAAHEVVRQLADTYASCEEEQVGGGTTWLYDVEQTDVGDAGWLVKQTYESNGLPAPGLDQYHVVRVGNAVLLVMAYSQAGPEEAGIQRAVDEMSGPVDALVGQMCAFAKEPCNAGDTGDADETGETRPTDDETTATEPEPTWTRTIPANFPLDTDTVEGDTDFSDPKTSDARGRPWAFDPCTPTSYSTDSERQAFRTVEQKGPDYADTRQLGLYPDQATAQEAMQGFRRVLDACAVNRSESEPGVEWRWETRSLQTGEDALRAVGTLHRGEGQAQGATYAAMVRVGNAVLVITREREGTPEQGAENETSREVRSLATTLGGEMCVFARNGC